MSTTRTTRTFNYVIALGEGLGLFNSSPKCLVSQNKNILKINELLGLLCSVIHVQFENYSSSRIHVMYRSLLVI